MASVCKEHRFCIPHNLSNKQLCFPHFHLLAEKEGVFVEPSSAAGVAGLIKAKANGELPNGKVIVITVTGNGLKDPHWALESAPAPRP